MSKLVVLELGEGDFEQQGFPVTLQIAEDGKAFFTKISGRLPPAPQVEQSYTRWQSRYRRLKSSMRLDHPSTEVQNVGDFEIGHIGDPEDECQQAGTRLCETLNDWLRSNSFASIREEFFKRIKSDEKIRIILQTDEHLLRKLPWSLWELLIQDYKYAEIALSPIKYVSVSSRKSKNKIKILAILGNSQNISVEEDRKILKQKLPDANIHFLVEPDRKELNEKLWEQGWDILFFAGHGESQGDSNKGWIKINEKDSLSIEDLKFALNKAIEKGLSLAIFNSCDGLGLAAELSAMQIPQMIVMRESIPDVVAQEFLKYFLAAFARGQSLYLAVREARERLQGLEGEFPCASWLPVIFQNPACTPLTWSPRSYTPNFRTVMAASVAVAVLMSGVRHLGWLQPLELKAYDQMMQLRPDEGLDDRILVVAVTEDDLRDDINAQHSKQRGWFSLSDVRLVRLLKEIKKYQPRAIGLDMYRDLPIDAKPNADLEKLFQENENLFAVCKVNDPKGDVGGIPPASFIPKENLVFSDVLRDSDDVLRRHLLSIEPSPRSPCTAENALSWELALQYLYNLHPKGIEPKDTPEGDVLLGKARLRALLPNVGGYQEFGNKGSDSKRLDYKNYHILLNYRTRGDVAKFVSVTRVLKQDIDIAQLVKDRIVLIGVIDSAVRDNFQTPYAKQMRGVFIQAQMVSQIISAALGERPLLGVWSWWADGLWICGWSIVGGLIVWRIRGAILVGVAIAVAIVILYGSCFLLFLQGTWVPLVPSVLVLTTISGILICYIQYRELQQV